MFKRKSIWLITAAAAFAASPLHAQEQKGAAPTALADADPAVWVVKDDDTTIYLFGTFHLLDGKQDWFNDEVKTAFDRSDEVVLEAKMPEDPAELQPLIVRYAVDPSGKTLTSKLPAATASKLGEALKELGAPAAALDMFEPWFASLTLTVLKAQSRGLQAEHGTEAVITKAAKASNKPVGELEGFEYQLKLFDGMPEKQQIAYLGQSLDQLSKVDEQLSNMVGAWAKGDADGIAKLMNDGLSESPELSDLLLARRNANWAAWIDDRLDKPGTVFVAVGAGHLAGDKSVQKLLAARGIATTRVQN